MIASKRIIIPALAATAIVGAAGLYGARSLALADSSTNQKQSLAQTIAGAFGLDASKVQNVITRYHQGTQAQREDNYEQHLQDAVTAGKLTQAQEQGILAEHNALAAEMKSAEDQTGSARRTALAKVRSDAEAWARAHNIDVHWLLRPERSRLRGDRGPANQGLAPSSSPTPSDSPDASPST